MFPNVKLGHIQWKMITNIGKETNIDNLIDVSDFFRLIEIAVKKIIISNHINQVLILIKYIMELSILQN